MNALLAGQLPVDRKLWLAKQSGISCSGNCKANNKSDPNCFCGWLPQPGSFKKKGLWQREQDLRANLGHDPRSTLRKVRFAPCYKVLQ